MRGTGQPWPAERVADPLRSATIAATRSNSSSSAASDAIAADCAMAETPNGTAHLRSASATGSCATAYPTRSPARPYAFENVRRTQTFGRSR